MSFCVNLAKPSKEFIFILRFVIGIPATFLLYKKNFRLPDDIWMVDLDSNKLTPAKCDAEIPPLPEPEGTILKNHLKQVKSDEFALIYKVFIAHNFYDNEIFYVTIGFSSFNVF